MKELFVLKDTEQLLHAFQSCRYFCLLEIVIFRNDGCLNHRILLDFLRLVHHFIGVDVEGRADEVEGLVPREERGEEDLAMDGGDRYGVVKHYCVVSLLDLLDVLPGDLHEGLPEEDVGWVELGVEAKSLVGDVESARQDDLVAQPAGKGLVEPFVRQEDYLCPQELLPLPVLFLSLVDLFSLLRRGIYCLFGHALIAILPLRQLAVRFRH